MHTISSPQNKHFFFNITVTRQYTRIGAENALKKPATDAHTHSNILTNESKSENEKGKTGGKIYRNNKKIS